jgi:hypothetical protein
MSVWFVCPSARPPEEAEKCLSLWRQQGYKIALWRDDPVHDEAGFISRADLVMHGTYPGYAESVNRLAREVLLDPSCDWIVTGGDDTEPDPNHTADEIAQECSHHFAWERAQRSGQFEEPNTFGVMQPTGDRFAFSRAQSSPQFPHGSAPIDRVAGSPWLGREWCQRINQGKGPLWHEYTHMFSDEELQCVAIKYGVFWQRPDLIHLHHHFQRESPAIDSKAVARPVPAHLVEANSPEHWAKYKKLFEDRKRAGFPGSDPL